MAGLENAGAGGRALKHPKRRRVLVIGAGWAGVSAAVHAAESGHDVTLMEASRQLGGRARSLCGVRFQNQSLDLDNGQHLLMTAYSATLDMMQKVGVDRSAALLEIPLDLRLPDGQGLALPAHLSRWPSKSLMLISVLTARGWSWHERFAMLRWGFQWERRGMRCQPSATVADLCTDLPQRLRDEWIDPLCISALNLPPAQASGQLFLNALADTVFSDQRHWRGLIPRVPLDQVLPQAAANWLTQLGHSVVLGQRATSLQRTTDGWRVNASLEAEHVVMAVPALAAADLAEQTGESSAHTWSGCARSLEHTAIATVYLHTSQRRIARAMQALPVAHPWDAQFVFDWSHLGRDHGVLAAVISHATGDAGALGEHVLHQVQATFGFTDLSLIKTVVEKRATFAATPNIKRPTTAVAPQLWACGDYVEGRYPATIEGAVRSAANIPWQQLEGRI